MRRDTIFYKLFQTNPTLLFDLLGTAPTHAAQYRFDSVAVKEAKFEIDGVFLPPEDQPPATVYFCEVQFQRDEQLYERLFGESFLYFYRQRSRFTDWQAVIIYPTRTIEQSATSPYEDLLHGSRVHRIYLDELGDLEDLPLGVALMVLTILDEAIIPQAARNLLTRSSQTELPERDRRGIMEMITTILAYKFTHLSRREVEAMLGITLQETRFYQEAKEEGREEGREEGIQTGLQTGRQEGLQTGRQEECRSLVLRLLTRRFGTLPEGISATLETRSLSNLEALAEALLDFTTIADLQTWLQNHPGDR
ncbi:Rpn family recombination-promoting nuclease/putative transposase [Alkalinema pantanalense CENA528]|uniref:Rpn family recombination-promoting nuclease/putative transposase n=1 Tax=Alkalinema pantanalense TaxID=1620705 RepID=UPI003D6FEAAB